MIIMTSAAGRFTLYDIIEIEAIQMDSTSSPASWASEEL
jgi:hypothetical protein